MAGWHVKLVPGAHFFGGAQDFLVLVDQHFPLSDPRIVVPNAPADFRWPHVEPGGLLCLASYARSALASDRVLQAIADAGVLGTYDENTKKIEFHREFKTYWDRKASEGAPTFLSLIAPNSEAEQAWFFHDRANKRYLFAETKEALRKWLRNIGDNPSDKDLVPVPLAATDDPWLPIDFPAYGTDVLSESIAEALQRFVTRGQPFPLLIKVSTPTGTVFAGIVLQSLTGTQLQKGFRSLQNVPWDRVIGTIAAKRVLRCKVERVDASWIHGRDHGEEFEILRTKRVAIVGCGAIGGAVARLLVQAGLLNLVLIDGDDLTPANTSRHVLGQRDAGQNKAKALETMLRRDFPHIGTVSAYSRSVQYLLAVRELESVQECDLVVSAGIDLVGDGFLDSWRNLLEASPAHLAAWAEEYATAAHAVLIIGKDRLLRQFNADGHPIFSATSWPGIDVRRFEAGCGNAFQPHSAVDLNNAIALTARLALDYLLGLKDASCRRAWLGDVARVQALGGQPTDWFVGSNTVREYEIPAVDG